MHLSHRTWMTVVACSSTVLVAGGLAEPAGAATPNGSAAVCVGLRQGCLATLAAAVTAVRAGGTITVSPGTFAGGVSIAKSVHLIGAGAGRTVIRGGGPVITIGGAADSANVTVFMSGLTITGGLTTGDGYISNGGGLLIAAGPEGELGATVGLTDVVISGNTATATTTSPSPSGQKCPVGDCPFALAAGGGIANSGRLTITRGAITGNKVDGDLSDARGGGIYTSIGSLTLKDSVVAGNHADPKTIGRFAEGGGLFVDDGSVLTVDHSAIVGNHADLVTSWPIYASDGSVIDMNANSGGVHVGDNVDASITHTVISGNGVSAIDPIGEPYAFDGAMLAGDSHVSMSDTVITGNRVTANVATSADVGPSGTALEFDGPADVARTVISGNTASEHAATGFSSASNGLAVYDFSDNPRLVTVTDAQIDGNTAVATSTSGAASALGGGIFNNSLLKLVNVTVTRNVLTAGGATSTAQGGGIWNGVDLSGPPVTLTLVHSSVTGNAASTPLGGTRQGGGLYTTEPVTLQSSTITHNAPDNCFGCS